MRVRAKCFLILTMLAGCDHAFSDSDAMPKSPDDRYSIGPVLHEESFRDEYNLLTELESGGSVIAKDGVLTIDVPAGCTVWYRPLIEGAVMIEYEARVIDAGGKNDRVSDLNCFWMARDARGPDSLEAYPRSGKFADYNELRGYYVGYGGNANTTTRFRRYIGDKQLRPLLPDHDLKDPANLLQSNVWQRVRIVAAGSLVQYWHNDKKVFELVDQQPYMSGWFGFRTVTSHQEIRNLRVVRMIPADLH